MSVYPRCNQTKREVESGSKNVYRRLVLGLNIRQESATSRRNETSARFDSVKLEFLNSFDGIEYRGQGFRIVARIWLDISR